jgi:hypothetical protein
MPAAKKAAFLAAYARCASVTGAAKAARMDRNLHYDWMRDDPAYPERFARTHAEAAQSLKDSAVEKAMVGVFEPNVFQGRFVYPQEEYVVKPEERDRRGRIIEPEQRAWRDVPGAPPLGIHRRSDSLHLALLRAFLPDEFRQQGRFELTGADGGPIEIVQRLNAARDRMAALAREEQNQGDSRSSKPDIG